MLPLMNKRSLWSSESNTKY